MELSDYVDRLAPATFRELLRSSIVDFNGVQLPFLVYHQQELP